MIFGLTTFTVIHVVLSLVGMIAGLVVAGALASGIFLRRWAVVFLITTILTNVTGFGFPFVTLLPGHVIGAISLVILALMIVAQYVKHMAGGWRRMHGAGVVVTTYFNTFILVVQLFRRLPALIAAAPTQSEPPFAITQVLVLGLFVWLGLAVDKAVRQPA